GGVDRGIRHTQALGGLEDEERRADRGDEGVEVTREDLAVRHGDVLQGDAGRGGGVQPQQREGGAEGDTRGAAVEGDEQALPRRGAGGGDDDRVLRQVRGPGQRAVEQVAVLARGGGEVDGAGSGGLLEGGGHAGDARAGAVLQGGEHVADVVGVRGAQVGDHHGVRPDAECDGEVDGGDLTELTGGLQEGGATEALPGAEQFDAVAGRDLVV